MPTLESKIDDLYKGPLSEFVAERGTLAKTLSGPEARRVKALQKPTVVPWAVNQVYWHARPAYDRLTASGEKLRAAQIAALKGKPGDVRRATEAHRQAMAEAVKEALRLASAAGAQPSTDDVTKTLEAISVAQDLPEPPGRLTRPLQPAGFEALAGVRVKARPFEAAVKKPPAGADRAVQSKAAERQREADDRRKQKAIEQARKAVARARAVEARTRGAWERARELLAAAELELAKRNR